MQVPTGGKVTWVIHSDLDYRAATNSSLITLSQVENVITITAKDMMGLATVNFYLDGTIAATAEIEVKSIWVS